MNNSYTYIDLFAGCGGLSLGLYQSGWHGLFAIEKSPHAFDTLGFNLISNINHFNWPSWLPCKELEINQVINNHHDSLSALKGKVDLVAGGPPCQGFSTAGKRNEDDHRNKLVNSYIEFIKITQPKSLLFENVKGFTTGFKRENNRSIPYSRYIWERLEKELGYSVYGKVVDFSGYGVPQKRERFILVGFKDNNPKEFFELLDKNKSKFLESRGLGPDNTVEDAISDLLKSNGIEDSDDSRGFKAGKYSLPNSNFQKLMRIKTNANGKPVDSHRFANHREATRKKFNHILQNATPGKNTAKVLDLEFRTKKSNVVLLDSSKPSPTVTSLPDDYIHYAEPRILTVRELARLQSFPDWFKFRGKYTTGGKERTVEVPRYTQVGNAIPPLFAEQCGIVLKEIL